MSFEFYCPECRVWKDETPRFYCNMCKQEYNNSTIFNRKKGSNISIQEIVEREMY